jgi:Arc/MetJ-type ribon-helix-helix transcriptional regulator
MNITLNPELKKWIDDEVKSGRYSNPTEFLNQAVHHFVLARDLGQEFGPEEVDKLIAEGLADLDANGGVDGDEFFRQMAAHSDAVRLARR